MKNQLYAFFVDNVTNYCYRNCLDYFPERSSILDVGIGNGIMMKNFHGLIRSKGLRITGIDINEAYLNQCNGLIETYGLEDHIKLHHSSVEAYAPPSEGYFDFILFSMSFMLFEDQRLVLDRTKGWLKPEGEIIFFQTIFRERLRFMEFIKPKLKYLTTVDFGQVTYEEAFFSLLGEKDLDVVEDRLIKKEWFKGEYRMIVTRHPNGRGPVPSI